MKTLNTKTYYQRSKFQRNKLSILLRVNIIKYFRRKNAIHQLLMWTVFIYKILTLKFKSIDLFLL